MTGQCDCDQGYYGDTCDVFDYCSYYEDLYNKTACTNGGMYLIILFCIYSSKTDSNYM